jgi:hypothetical protein
MRKPTTKDCKLQVIGRDPSKEGLNVSPINQHKTYTERLCEEIESPSTTNIGMVDSEWSTRQQMVDLG